MEIRVILYKRINRESSKIRITEYRYVEAVVGSYTIYYACTVCYYLRRTDDPLQMPAREPAVGRKELKEI